MISESREKIKLNTALLVVNGRNNSSGEETPGDKATCSRRKATNKTTDKAQVKIKGFRRRISNKYSYLAEKEINKLRKNSKRK